MELLRETFEGGQFTTVQQRISFPAIGWNVVYLPNAPQKPTLTYIDQLIRPSLKMRVQSQWQWDDVSIVMDSHNLNAPKLTTTYLASDRYHELVLATIRLKDLFTHIRKDSKADVIDDIDKDCVVMGIPNPPSG